MKKLKIYLDTSVVSMLDQPDAPERMADTRSFWERIKNGDYDIVISSVVTQEIGNCEPEKKRLLTDYLGEIKYEFIEVGGEMVKIAEQLVDLRILKQKSFDDCRHIAAAIVANCDAICSWNFKHIVNPKTMSGVKAVTALNGCRDLLIYTPASLVKGDEYDS
ncbi:MAG: PIN domain nuclease [Planctomycetota bacterium]|jgi:predicted nucleic acid-binding protein|nr:PIN domain nuclease [Planctomycetota bacterium]